MTAIGLLTKKVLPVFVVGMILSACAISTPEPVPIPTIYEEICENMQSLNSQNHKIREIILAEESFIRRSEIAVEHGILPKLDRQKAHDLWTELDLYVQPFLDDMMEILLKEPRKNPKQLGEIGEWAKESAAIFNYLANEIEYFTMVGEERRQWQTQEIVNTQMTVNEYILRALPQDSVYEQLMEKYCKQ